MTAWPSCCGLPQFSTPFGFRCALRCDEEEPPDDGLFPAPVPAPRSPVPVVEFIPRVRTYETAGDLL